MTETAHPAPGATPSQTVGPFFAIGLPYDDGPRVAPAWRPDAIRLRGRVTDGEGEPVPDALIEIMQADGAGAVPRSPGALNREAGDFSGFGRSGTDADGGYRFSTVRPGPVNDGAPYIAMLIFARGLLKPVATRVYFPDSERSNAADPVLSAVPEDRRHTMLAERVADGEYRFDIRLQGEDETVFLAV